MNKKGFKLIGKSQKVQGFHVKTGEEKQMETSLQNAFLEYKELETQMNRVFEDAAQNNFGYGSDAKKKYEKYHQLRKFFLQYMYGLVKCGYINERNKQEIIRRFKRIKTVSVYDENDMVFGDNRDFGENVTIRLRDGLNEQLASRIFYHEFNHSIIGGNLHARYLNDQIERICKLTVNNYGIQALLKDGFLDELFAQDVAETIQAEIDGIHRAENDFTVYGGIQKTGIDFSKTITGCESIKDLTIKSFDKNFIDEILSSYDDVGELQKVLTTLQMKLEKDKSNFYPQNSNKTHSKIPTGFSKIKIEGPIIDEKPRKEDILDDRELSKVLEKNRKRTTSFTEKLRVEHNRSGFRTMTRSDANTQSTNSDFRVIKRTEGFDVGDDL